ncbi:MAG: molybdate ABC transporter substrate-binding protein [Thiolinea sp.]
MLGKYLPLVPLLLLALNSFAAAGSVQVAVASNFSKPMQQIAAAFESETGHQASLSFGSSGKFVAQISHGAPFDVFLSADTDKPLKLIEMGLADAETVFTYARGRLVLWSADADYLAVGAEVLERSDFRHMALAESKLAPYGRAAQEVLEKLQLTEKLSGKIVTGENISQAFQFISTGNAELGFVAAAQVYRGGKLQRGSAWLIPDTYYTPIRQDAILLHNGRDNVAAKQLMVFLRSETAVEIMRNFAYQLPVDNDSVADHSGVGVDVDLRD